MALNITNNYLQSLVEAGADSQSNLYVVNFNGGTLTDYDQNLMVRCEGFTPPNITQDSYSVSFITAKIDRPSTKVNVTRNFQLTFRIDANYNAFKALLNQQKITSNLAKSFVATDIQTLSKANKLFNVSISTVSQGVVDPEIINQMTIYSFKDCWVTNITPTSYTTGDATAATCTVNISFLTMEDLQSGFTGQGKSPNVPVGLTVASQTLNN